MHRTHLRNTPRLALPVAACAALLVASALGAGCSDEGGDTEVVGATVDAGGDADAGLDADANGDVGADGGSDIREDIVEPPVCTGPVCFAPLAAEDYPEAQDPPRHALHCNERGLTSGCPEGTRCGNVRELPDGRRGPVCEASGPLDDLRLDFAPASSLPAGDDTVAVDLRFRTAGEPFPARDATLLPNNPWTSRVRLTHRESGAQWAEPLPERPADGVLVNLPRGVYDVLLITNEVDFPAGGIPTTETRGILTVEDAGEAVIDPQMASLTLRLRYLDSTLTGAESAALIVSLEGESGQTITHQYTAQERGIAELALREGQYELSVRSNGTLPSLFPATPLTVSVDIRVPETRDIVVDLAPALVEVPLTVNGEPAGSDGDGRHALLFESDGVVQRASVSPSSPGVARALLWPGGRYDVWYSDGAAAHAPVARDWSPRASEPLAASVTLEPVSFELDLSDQIDPGGIFANLTLRHSDAEDVATFVWIEYIGADEDGILRWETELVPGEPYDVGLNANQRPFPQGRWTIAEDLEIAERNVLEPELVEVEIDVEFTDADGRPVTTSGAQFYLEGDDPNMEFIYLSLGSGATSFTTYGGRARASMWPVWDNTRRVPYQRYQLGEVDLEEGAAFELSTRVHRMQGELQYEGEPFLEGDRFDYAYLQVSSPAIGSQTHSFSAGSSDFNVAFGPGTYNVDVYCGGEGCGANGVGVNVVRLIEAIRFR